MILIVEGIDKVGKTILCNRLSKELNIPIYERPSGDSDYKFDELKLGDVYAEQAALMSQLRKSNESKIFDRFHLSEFVYGKLNRNYYEKLNRVLFAMPDYMAYIANAILIYVRPADMNRSNIDHGSNQWKTLQEFDDIAQHSGITQIITTFNEFDELVKKLKEIKENELNSLN